MDRILGLNFDGTQAIIAVTCPLLLRSLYALGIIMLPTMYHNSIVPIVISLVVKHTSEGDSCHSWSLLVNTLWLLVDQWPWLKQMIRVS